MFIINQDGKQEIVIKLFLLITFIGGHGGKSNNSMILVKFSSLRHGFNLLEGNADAMDSHPIHELEMLGA